MKRSKTQFGEHVCICEEGISTKIDNGWLSPNFGTLGYASQPILTRTISWVKNRNSQSTGKPNNLICSHCGESSHLK